MTSKSPLLKLAKPGRALAKIPHFEKRFPTFTPKNPSVNLPTFSLLQKLQSCGKKLPSASTARLRLKLKVNLPPNPGSVCPPSKSGFVIDVKCTPSSTLPGSGVGLSQHWTTEKGQSYRSRGENESCSHDISFVSLVVYTGRFKSCSENHLISETNLRCERALKRCQPRSSPRLYRLGPGVQRIWLDWISRQQLNANNGPV